MRVASGIPEIPSEITGLLSGAHVYAPTLHEHGMRTARVASIVAKNLNVEALERDLLTTSAYLHDIGKLFIPTSILLKNGPLTVDEFAIVRRHPALGMACLESFPALGRIARIVGQHHERLDGRGYPHRVKGSRIDPLAKILSASDAFVAMVEDRPYRPTLSRTEALNQLRAGSGTQFEPAIVAAVAAVADAAFATI